MNEIEDGIYLHKVFDIAYLVRGEEVMIRNEDVPYWELSDMDREHMQTLLDNGLIYRLKYYLTMRNCNYPAQCRVFALLEENLCSTEYGRRVRM